MKGSLFTLLIGLALALSGCDFANILHNDAGDAPGGASADTLLYVDITGGIAGVSQQLLVETSGRAVFTDNTFTGETRTLQLSESELINLNTLFLSNNFFALQDSYTDPQIADAFLYTIRFTDEKNQKVVHTDYFSAPENLQNIVDGIVHLREQITAPKLALQLSLDKSAFAAGETISMRLLVANSGSEEIPLRFSTGQIFDFSVFRAGGDATADRELVWNWAHDKFFTLAMMVIPLPGGDSLSYEVVWDGTANDGTAVTGDFVVRAALLSSPGGGPAEKHMTIAN